MARNPQEAAVVEGAGIASEIGRRRMCSGRRMTAGHMRWSDEVIEVTSEASALRPEAKVTE